MPESILNKKTIMLLSGIVAAIVIGSLFAVSYGSYFDMSTASIPFPVYNGINIGDYFAAPTTGLSVIPSSGVGDTPAPAITGCKITNDVNLVATDGTSYSLSNTSPPFSPMYSVVSNPYNGKTMSSVLVNVNLYCDPSTLVKYNYYPYLTGGTISVMLQGRGPTQAMMTEFTGSQSVSAALVNGQTVQIAQFSIPISQVSSVLPTSPSNYYSQQNVVTTGILYFKQGQQAFQQTATHVVSPLYTSFSFLISPSVGVSSQPQPVASCPPNYYSVGVSTNGQTQCQPVPAGTVTPYPQPMANGVPIPAQPTTQVTACPQGMVVIQNPTGGTCVNLIQNISLAGGKTVYSLPSQNYVIYQIVVNSWYQGQPYPTVKITNLDTQTSNVFTLSPNSRGSGYPLISTNTGSLVMTDILYFNTDLNNQVGRYQIQLMPVSLGSYSRPSVSQDFVIFNIATSNPLACNPNYYMSNGQCVYGSPPTNTQSYPASGIPPSNAPTNVGSIPASNSGNSPVSLPTQSSNNVCVTLSANSGQCVPVSNTLGTNPVIGAFQQLLLYFHAYG